MKRMLVCASLIGLAAGAVYWICKYGKSNPATSSAKNENKNLDADAPKKQPLHDDHTLENLNQAKFGISQSIQERHAAAGSIMKETYSNIAEDIVHDSPDEPVPNAKDKESELIIKQTDSISDELDELLKQE